jgi:hypothetical protein
MSPECCSRALLPGGSWARGLGDGAGSRPCCCSIRIGRSCTTVPVQNGERSMRAAQGAQARNRSSPIVIELVAELIETSHAFGLHPIRRQYGLRLHGRRACDGVGEYAERRSRPAKLLDEYFCSRRTGGPLTEDDNPWTDAPKSECGLAARPSEERFAQSEHSPDNARRSALFIHGPHGCLGAATDLRHCASPQSLEPAAVRAESSAHCSLLIAHCSAAPLASIQKLRVFATFLCRDRERADAFSPLTR